MKALKALGSYVLFSDSFEDVQIALGKRNLVPVEFSEHISFPETLGD